MQTKTDSIGLVLFFIGLTVLTGCKEEPEEVSLPLLTTTTAAEVTVSSALVASSVFVQGSSEITERGFCWSTDPNPEISDNKLTRGNGLGQFTGRITGLLPGTDYHVRSWASNFEGTSYGAPILIRTPLEVTKATLATLEPESITLTSAVSGGDITDIGGGEITERGICWSTDPDPTVAGSKAAVAISGAGSGRFALILSDLESGKKYYVRSYAINSAGVSYGPEYSFRTLAYLGAKSSGFPGTLVPTVTFSIENKIYTGLGSLDWGMADTDLWEWDQVSGQWTRLADFPGTAGGGSVSFTVGGKGYVLQNIWFSEDGNITEFWEYDPGSDRWTRKANLPTPGFRVYPVAFSIGPKGYIGLGEVVEDSPYNTGVHTLDLWEWDQATDAWTRKADFPGQGRSGAAAFTIGNKGYVATGATEDGMVADFWEYDQQSDEWTRKNDFAGNARSGAFGFSSGSKGYLGAGIHSASPGDYGQDVWEWDQSLDSWTQIGFITANGYAEFGGHVGAGGYYITGYGLGPALWTFPLTSDK